MSSRYDELRPIADAVAIGWVLAMLTVVLLIIAGFTMHRRS